MAKSVAMDDKRTKTLGLQFARTMQICVRTAVVFGTNHRPGAMQLQQSFDHLNSLLKQFDEFTVGFLDGRVLINKLLVKERGLSQLETDFLKRGIGAVSFEVGVTFNDFKRCVEVLSTSATTITEQGGIQAYLYTRPIPKVRILPAPQNQSRTESGDIIVETDVESLLASRSAPKLAGMMGTDMLELLLHSTLQQIAANGTPPPQSLQLVSEGVQQALVTDDGDPQKAYQILARMLQQLRPEFVLSAFPAEQRERLRSLRPNEVAAEFMEKSALDWAVRQLVSAPNAADAFVVERSVITVLLRCLKATQTAERLAWRIEELYREHKLPMGLYQRIREEIEWEQLPLRVRHMEMLKVQRYDACSARRVIAVCKELVSNGIRDGAAEVVRHYFATLAHTDYDLQPAEIEWAQALLQAVASVQPVVRNAVEVLSQSLLDERLDGETHQKTAECLSATARAASLYEDYDPALIVCGVLRNSQARDPERHARCCGTQAKNLLPSSSLERILEITLDKRSDSVWLKKAMNLWALDGPLSVELLLERLEAEEEMRTRLFLVRLLGQMPFGLDLIRQRLAEDRWYVVRNACVMLAELKDPELIEQLGPVLRHGDHRVQQAAFNAIVQSRDPRCAAVLADALPYFRARLLEQALEEIMLLRDPSALPGLEQYITGDVGAPEVDLKRALHALMTLPGDDSLYSLATIVAQTRLSLDLRRVAVKALGRNPRPLGEQLLTAFLETFPDDPLAMECGRLQGMSDSK